MKHQEQSGNQKKWPVLTGLLQVLPLGQCHSEKVLLCTQNVCTKVLLCSAAPRPLVSTCQPMLASHNTPAQQQLSCTTTKPWCSEACSFAMLGLVAIV